MIKVGLWEGRHVRLCIRERVTPVTTDQIAIIFCIGCKNVTVFTVSDSKNMRHKMIRR